MIRIERKKEGRKIGRNEGEKAKEGRNAKKGRTAKEVRSRKEGRPRKEGQGRRKGREAKEGRKEGRKAREERKEKMVGQGRKEKREGLARALSLPSIRSHPATLLRRNFPPEACRPVWFKIGRRRAEGGGKGGKWGKGRTGFEIELLGPWV